MKKALMLCAAVLLLLSLCACSTLARSIAGASSAASSAVNSYGDAAGAVSRPEDSGNDSRFVSGEEDPYSAREDSAASGEKIQKNGIRNLRLQDVEKRLLDHVRGRSRRESGRRFKL